MIVRKTDANQADIVKALRKLPKLSVFSTHIVGKGFPDIVVGYKGINYLFEIKDGAKPKSSQKLTTGEVKFHSEWNGQIDIITNIDDALNILKIKK